MRRVETDERARFGDAVEFSHHEHEVFDVLYDLVADDEVELVIGKRVGRDVEVVNYVSVGAGIVVESDGSGRFARAATEIENLQIVYLFSQNRRGQRVRVYGCGWRKAASAVSASRNAPPATSPILSAD